MKILTYILPVSGKTQSSLTIKHTDTIQNNWGLLPSIRDLIKITSVFYKSYNTRLSPFDLTEEIMALANVLAIL